MRSGFLNIYPEEHPLANLFGTVVAQKFMLHVEACRLGKACDYCFKDGPYLRRGNGTISKR